MLPAHLWFIHNLGIGVRDGGLSNTRCNLDWAHSNDIGVLLAMFTY